MRLDRLLANSGYGSRSAVRQLIRSGRITVDGCVVRDPGFTVAEGSAPVVERDSLILTCRRHIHLMLNKPAGLVTAMEDPNWPTVAELIPPAWQHSSLVPVGRLDRDATGLLLLTSDGMLNHRLASPRWGVWKTYRVTYAGQPLTEQECRQFTEGLVLPDGLHCRPALLTRLPDNQAQIAIHEGKFHQVKRMVQAVGREVTRLHRQSFGPLQLDASLEPGICRELEKTEADALYQAVQLPLL